MRLLSDQPLFSPEQHEIVKEKFFREAAKLLEPQVTMIHNIHAWMGAAVAACANVLGDRAMLERTIYSEFGWVNQLEKGCRKDGLWYEISPGYHFYTMNALLSLGWVAKSNGIDLFSHPALRQMGLAPLYLAYPDNTLPAYNDTACGDRLSVSVYEQLTAVYGDPLFNQALEDLYAKAQAGNVQCFAPIPNPLPIPGFFGGRGSFFAFFHKDSQYTAGEALRRDSSFLLADTGIAALQNENLRVGVKASKYGGGHDHDDKISIDVYDKRRNKAISYDTGTSGYGIAFTREWQRSSVSHNLVVVNGQKQQHSDGQVAFFTPDMVKAVAESPYPGVRMEREIRLLEAGFQDRYYVRCGEEAVLDYTFHCLGDATLPGIETTPVDAPLFADNGYPTLLNLRRALVDGSFEVLFQGDDGALTMRMEACPGTEVFVGCCFRELELKNFGIVIVRRKAVETTFVGEYDISR